MQPSGKTTLVLASGSPRRAEMLGRLGVEFLLLPQTIDEQILPGEAPEAYALRVARAKAEAALTKIGTAVNPGDPETSGMVEVEAADTVAVLSADTVVVLSADTVVVLQGRILGKPVSRTEAGEMIRSLSGRDHHVVTGWWLVRSDGKTLNGTARTRVRFRVLRNKEVQGYLDMNQWRDKAGGYGIQEGAAFMVEEVEGSYTNVVGLPLSQVTDALWQSGAVDRLPARPGKGQAHGNGSGNGYGYGYGHGRGHGHGDDRG